MKILFIAALVLGSCSFKKNPLVNQTHQGHDELYSEPSAPKEFDSDEVKRIVIAATNDLEAAYTPHVVSFKDDHQPGSQQIEIGGAQTMSSYFNTLREEYKNVLLVDSGDIFSSRASLREVQAFYETNKYDALTMGLNDFNLKLPKGISSSSQLFRDFANDSDVPVLLSNLYELKTARGVEWKGTSPHVLKDVGGVKVGIIGLIPDDIVSLTPVDNRVGLFVEDMLTNTLRQARLLRSLGAEIIVVLTHQGLQCGHQMAQENKLPLEKVNFEPKKPGACDLSGPLGTYLERLPPHLVDVVIAGRVQEKIANYVNETLVLSSFGHGKSMVYAEFFVDAKSRKVLKEKTNVHQPIMFCREFFKETNDCFPHDPSIDHKERTPAKFLGKDLLFNSSNKVSTFEEKKQIDLSRALEEIASDIAFAPPTSGTTQLVRLDVKGIDLTRLLEEDFNNGSQKNWVPSPFTYQDKLLHLKIRGEEIDPAKSYSVLTDLEGVQTHKLLVRAIVNGDGVAQNHHSWSSFEVTDSVKTKMAASTHL